MKAAAQYCYTHPLLGRAVFGSFASRDEAARDCLTRDRRITGGGTYAVLTIRDGVVIPERNSFVGWNDRDGEINHDLIGLQRARIK